jgi:predicted nuclease of predicted toxin-antitoxin system
LPASLADELNELGHVIDTVPAENLTGKPDPDIWSAAQKEARFLTTQDMDFSDMFVDQRTRSTGVVEPATLDTSTRDLKLRPMFYLERIEVLEMETKIANQHRSQFREGVDERRFLPTTSVVWKTELPMVTGFTHTCEPGVRPRIFRISTAYGK